MPSREENLRIWDQEYSWTEHGDEWSDQAAFCGQPYNLWKESIIENLIRPRVRKSDCVVEIAPGHGRWSGHLSGMCKSLTLVDMSPTCIDFCRKKFSSLGNISYQVNDGRTLSGIPDSSVDFIWSFDSFVHIDRAETESYLSEFARVLKKRGQALIHHPGRKHSLLPLGSVLMRLWIPGRLAYGLLTTGRLMRHYGMRSDISRELFAGMARKSGLEIVSQTDSWGKNGRFNVKLFRDCLSLLEKRGD